MIWIKSARSTIRKRSRSHGVKAMSLCSTTCSRRTRGSPSVASERLWWEWPSLTAKRNTNLWTDSSMMKLERTTDASCRVAFLEEDAETAAPGPQAGDHLFAHQLFE